MKDKAMIKRQLETLRKQMVKNTADVNQVKSEQQRLLNKNYEWLAMPFFSRSNADIKPIIPTADKMQEYINDLKKSIEREKDEVKKKKKIIILEEYIIYHNELKNRL